MPPPSQPDPSIPEPPDRPVPPSEGEGHGRDPVTSREGLELELMEDDDSEEGEHLGEHNH